MLSNKQLKYLKSLHLRKFRQKYGIFLAEGVKTANEILQFGKSSIVGVYALPSWLEKHQRELDSIPSSMIFELDERQLKAVSLLKTPNQVLMLMKQPETRLKWDMLSQEVGLYLDEIRDPGNLGTILRIADWFGIKWVLLSEKCVEVYNPKTIQSSMGAFLRVDTAIVQLDELIGNLPNLPVMGMVLEGQSIYQIAPPKAALIVIGNESNGISEETAKKLNTKIAIPRHPLGGAESLNAAVATGIVCSWARQTS